MGEEAAEEEMGVACRRVVERGSAIQASAKPSLAKARDFPAQVFVIASLDMLGSRCEERLLVQT